MLRAAVAVTAAVVAAVSVASASSARPSIVGGSPAKMSEHPYVVYLADDNGRQYCGGTLVRANWVVTAAHCVSGENPADVIVVAGRQDTRTDDGVEARVTRIWIPEEYGGVGGGGDIAVLQLNRWLPYRTLPLATKGDAELYAAGRQATVLGWGHTAEHSGPSPLLRSARVPLQPDRVCADAYGGYEPAAMVCAGYARGGIDACQGDSGGPLVSGGRLIGIVSWGEGCARPGKPGVYTEVRAYAARAAAREPAAPVREQGGSLLGILGG